MQNRYRITQYVNAGGSSSVYRAEDLEDGQPKAVKILHDHLSASSDNLRRFSREATALEKLDHPHICRVCSHGLLARGQPYIVIDWVEGPTLHQVLEQQKRLPVKQALSMALELCDALAFAHQCGIVHRDIKPENIIVCADGVKLVDFGLAMLSGVTNLSTGLTATGQLLGTPYYMSPEQCQGLQSDVRTDVYSLGCVLYEMLMGQKAFFAENGLACIQLHLQTDPKPFSEVRPELFIPTGLEEIVFRALNRDPDQRFANMKIFKASLQAGRDLSVGRPKKQAGYDLRIPLAVAACLGVLAAAVFWFTWHRQAPTVAHKGKTAGAPGDGSPAHSPTAPAPAGKPERTAPAAPAAGSKPSSTTPPVEVLTRKDSTIAPSNAVAMTTPPVSPVPIKATKPTKPVPETHPSATQPSATHPSATHPSAARPQSTAVTIVKVPISANTWSTRDAKNNRITVVRGKGAGGSNLLQWDYTMVPYQMNNIHTRCKMQDVQTIEFDLWAQNPAGVVLFLTSRNGAVFETRRIRAIPGMWQHVRLFTDQATLSGNSPVRTAVLDAHDLTDSLGMAEVGGTFGGSGKNVIFIQGLKTDTASE